MSNKTCTNRLQKEYRTLLKEPVSHITAHPSPTSLLEWHYVLEGPDGTEFVGGVYHGKITFPASYPFKPPSISMFTPSGRFATNTKLCLSMTDFHPESWNPMWSVGTILAGLLSFMPDSQQTTGSIVTTAAEKGAFAAASLAFNVKNPQFRKLFPEWVEEHNRRLAAPAQSASLTGGSTAAAADQPAAASTSAAAEAGQGQCADSAAGAAERSPDQQADTSEPAAAGRREERLAADAAAGGAGPLATATVSAVQGGSAPLPGDLAGPVGHSLESLQNDLEAIKCE